MALVEVQASVIEQTQQIHGKMLQHRYGEGNCKEKMLQLSPLWRQEGTGMHCQLFMDQFPFNYDENRLYKSVCAAKPIFRKL